MSDPPRLGPPVAIAISTHDDGKFTVEFGWEQAPDALWLKAVGDLMKRSGRNSVETTDERVVIRFDPGDAEFALDDLTELLEDADRSYLQELENRAAALEHVKEALQVRYGVGPDLPVRDS